MQPIKPRSLTAYEEFGLNRTYNLADGHAHQDQSNTQKLIIENLMSLFYEAESDRQEVIEKRFKQEFFSLAGQSSMQSGKSSFLGYSASMSIDVIAKYLKMKNLSVSLMHPTFDNLAAILKREGVLVEPMDEERLCADRIDEYLQCLMSDAIFLVCPNNPTGWVPDQTKFRKIAEHCKRQRKVLLIDFCFRFFCSDLLRWDQYRLLLDMDIDFLTIEDTGKTWPSLDLKVGMTTCSDNIWHDVHNIHADLLLNVSPFTLSLLYKYIEGTRRNGLVKEIIDIVETNRHFLLENLHDTLLTSVRPSSISVEWLSINSTISAHKLWDQLRRRGVYVLPGNYFFWNQPGQGDKYMRIALMRPVVPFREAVSVLRDALLDIGCG